MSKIIKYRILPNIKTVVEYYSGEIFVEDLFEIKKEISKQHDYSPNYNLIMDLRDTDLKMDQSDVLKYIEFVKSSSRIKGERNSALLTEKPNEFVVATLFGLINKDLPINTSVFTTLGAAVNWLFNSFRNFSVLEKTLNNLKNAP